MSNTLKAKKNWWKRHWKWLVPVSGVFLLFITIFFSSGMGSVTTDLVQAYADETLYTNALKKAKLDDRVTELLGDIEPIDKLAILEGQVKYANNNEKVQSSIRIIGDKGRGMMDISARWEDAQWKYTKIQVRIKKPIEKKQTLEIDIGE